MTESPHSHRLTQWILVGLVVGVLLGLFTRLLPMSWQNFLITPIYGLIGQLFLRLIMMLVVPIVLVSLLCGAQALTGKALGRVGGRAICFYLLTTAIAVLLALLVADFLAVGEGAKLTVTTPVTHQPVTWIQTVLNMVPNNPFSAMVNGNMLPILVFALLVGIAIASVSDRVPVLKQFLQQSEIVLAKLMMMIMRVAPFGIAALLARVFATQGLSTLMHLFSYFLVVILVLALQCVVIYSLFLKLIGRLSPVIFFKKMSKAMIFAFSVSSSVASIPLVLDTVKKRLGVHPKVASFIIPLGATINMDGTAIMQGVATIFIAHAYGVPLTFLHYLLVIAMATLASIGTAGVPSVGLITLAMVLKQVGLPLEGIALIVGVDRLLDMLRTAVNVAGDAMIATVVAKQVDAIDQKQYKLEHENGH